MAISTEISGLLADQIFAIYSHAESLMLDKVAKRAAKGIKEEGWAERKLKEVNEIRREAEKYTNDLDKLSKAKLDQAIIDAYNEGRKSAEDDFGLPRSLMGPAEVPVSVQRLILEANNMVAQTSVGILRDIMDAYRDIQAESAMGVLTGVDTRKQATQRMLNKLADRGITSFVDKAGRRWEMASYAEMATRTVTARAAIQGHMDRQSEAGRDLVIVSHDGMPCPVCRPWEGRILSISGKGPGYPSVGQATSSGLFHPNCKHTLTGYIPGLSRPSYSDAHGPRRYEYSQQQRENERQIRRWKRREIVAMSPQDLAKAKAKISEYQAAQRKLLNDYEHEFGVTMRRKYDRESIKNRAGYKGIDGSPSWTQIKPKPQPPLPPKPPRKPREPKFDPTKYQYIYQDPGGEKGLTSYNANIVADSQYVVKLPRKKVDVVNYYSASNYRRMNRYMRTDGAVAVDEQEVCETLKQVLTNTPGLHENTLFFRHSDTSAMEYLFSRDVERLTHDALSNDADALKKLKKALGNATFSDKAFLSTSYKTGIFVESEGVEFQLYMPKGFNNGLFIESVSDHRGEAEFLINSNQKFKIVDIEIGQVPYSSSDRASRNTVANLIIKIIPIK